MSISQMSLSPEEEEWGRGYLKEAIIGIGSGRLMKLRALNGIITLLIYYHYSGFQC